MTKLTALLNQTVSILFLNPTMAKSRPFSFEHELDATLGEGKPNRESGIVNG